MNDLELSNFKIGPAYEYSVFTEYLFSNAI